MSPGSLTVRLTRRWVKKYSTKQLHKKKAWDLWSKIVRISGIIPKTDGLVRCYTCGRAYRWTEMDAGHYRHNKLDFCEWNIKPQCTHCNKYESGHRGRYLEHLIREYGVQVIDWLDIAQKTEPKKRTVLDYLDMIDDFKQRLKKLKEEKEVK